MTPVAQPSFLFAAGLPLACAGGAFAQRHRGLLVGSGAHTFEWALRLGGLAFLLGVIALVWRAHGDVLLASLTGATSTGTPLDAGVLVSAPLDGLLIFLAWAIGRRLYARVGLLDVQPWERGDEGLRVGRLRLVQSLWRDTIAGAILVAAALWVLQALASTPIERDSAVLAAVVALPAYLGVALSAMAWLTGIARRSAWMLEGIVLVGRLPSPWTPATRRVAALAALAVAALTVSPLLGLMHTTLLWSGAALLAWVIPLVIRLFQSFAGGIAVPPMLFWPRFRFFPPRPYLPPEREHPTASMLISLVLVVLLSWLIWWVLVKLLDRLPAVAMVAREHRGRAFLGLVLAWLRGWWRRGVAFASTELSDYRARRTIRRVERVEGHLNGLPPRTIVLTLYRRTLRRAGALGWRRAPAQTPGEFAARLRGRAPAGDAVVELTDAFEEARYSHHEIPPARARQALALWRQVRRRLRPRQG